jgi:ABC-type Fe2+-enterobactin transport system substrate-binding protein
MKIVNLKNSARRTTMQNSGSQVVQKIKSAAITGLAGLAVLYISAPSVTCAAEGANKQRAKHRGFFTTLFELPYNIISHIGRLLFPE